MSRGLSALQQSMLIIAHENHAKERPDLQGSYRVLLFNRKDEGLREVVPEAFTEYGADGFWDRGHLVAGFRGFRHDAETVSYTHLTLPTICSV